MRPSLAAAVLLAVQTAWSLPTNTPSSEHDTALDLLDIQAPDGSIKASFIRVGGTVVHLYVKDKTGTFRDVVAGYDDRSLYLSDPVHPYFGPVVGRYANRIKNSTFTTPNGKTAHIDANDNNGLDTLHGGGLGWDRRVWTLADMQSNSLTFSLYDPAGAQGFPGSVNGTVKYTLENQSKWSITMQASPDQQTPILLSSHVYWNLEGYQYTGNLSQHYLQLKADRYIETDTILIPTGEIGYVEGTPLDFRQPTQLQTAIQATEGKGYCGGGCVGLDNCWIYSNKTKSDTVMSLWSTASGIRLDVTTDQIAAQVYTCNGIANRYNVTRKASQGGDQGGTYGTHTCVVLEQESYIDAINNPQWGINQFYNKGDTYKWNSVYSFSIDK